MNLNVILFLVFANFLIFAAALLENRGDEVKIVQKRASAGNNGKKSDIDRSIKQKEVYLTAADFELAKSIVLDKSDPKDIIDPTDQRRSGLFEGDIKGFAHEKGQNRNAIRSQYQKWPAKQVPYTLSSQYGPNSRATIAAAMQEYAQQTCIRFIPRTTENDYVFITPDNGCYSLVGRTGGQQTLSLDDGCIQKGVIIHELMHSIGFVHEQSRTDRDQYIEIRWENVASGFADQFEKYSANQIDPLNTQYDYGSIMHYGARAFSKNGQPTIVPKQSGAAIGQRSGLSSNDRVKINRLYQCDGGVNPGPAPAPGPSGESGSCADIRIDCEMLKNVGYCTNTNLESWMSQNCRRTCGKCGGGTGQPPISSGQCSDMNSQCSSWSQYCNNPSFSSFLTSNCARTCNRC